ncbi:MAG: HAD family phosphatase [Actinobacteria bacterium]|nr:HAD family phosphatase [Actinomycetota bacterium]
MDRGGSNPEEGLLERALREFGPEARWPGLRETLGRVRVVYTDLDGTMMGPGGCFLRNLAGEYTLRPARALVEALRRGVDVVPVSGRSAHQLREDARLLGLRNYIAELGVELVYDLGEEVVLNTGALEGECGDLYRAIMESGAVDYLLGSHPQRLEFHTPWSDYRECTPIFRGLVDLEEVNRFLEESFPGLELVDNGVIPRTYPGLEVPEVRAYHLVPRGVSKEKAVAEDMRRRGFERREAVAVGDSEADLAQSEVVGVFFLVRNGLLGNPHLEPLIASTPNVVVTKGFLNEGWAEALELAVLGG